MFLVCIMTLWALYIICRAIFAEVKGNEMSEN
jgi:hypothetical protein